ncbi:MAG TPA: ABC transporter ATP-binding protein [Propionibacteriaceae bacterium]|nr:ABC transporter ATP-binding protein [Propionibacteriaceae bacterium]
MSLLEVRDLRVRFGRRRPAVDQVSFTIDRGERLGVIGESGSGKTVTALAVMGLLAENAVVSGSVELAGHAITALPERDLARLRGDLVTMVFQEPMTALDPTMPVGRQVAETLLLHADVERGSARARVIELLAEVGLSDPVRVAAAFPHQLSGGQRQRAILAMALINAPQLVICDEPTTALDVTVQAQVLAKLDQALTASGAACLFISHDLAVVSQICDRVLVMLEGRIVERGTVAELFSAPQHPYTRGLVEAASLDRIEPGQRLPTVAGLLDDPAGES